ncbi:MAG: 23S rRNA (uracil(1939)-C(5))-methyltransferase RlmD [Desulfobacteraceae bacterium]|nr:23S rRNA (uracil(1939)-C(5))-methyltransferase RlmD [Desulfobacteraceae bacterium]
MTIKIKRGHILELSISDMAFGGKGVAKIDGFTVFVDMGVPEDVVTARITKKKKNYAEARVVDLLSASPFRQPAPCPYSGICGGCKWQFLDYQKQLEYKRSHVQESLEHIGGMQGVNVLPTLGSLKQFAYRNKMEFSCSDKRWLLPEEMSRETVEPGFGIGLHVPGTFYKVLDIDACLLQPERGNEILDDVRAYIRSSPAPVYGLRSHKGYWRFLMLRHSVALDQWMVNIITAIEDQKTVAPLARLLVDKYPEITAVVNNITAKKSGVAIGEYEIHLAGKSTITERIGEFEFDISANSFFQTNTRGAKTLYDVAKRFAGLTGAENVVDLYCGTGTIAIYLSDMAKSVVGLEMVTDAVQDAKKNCEKNGVGNVRFITGDIRFTMDQIETVPEVMIIDPPRAGMHKDVVKKVLELAPAKIVYVSCNPATMARDLALIKDHYTVGDVQPVDMFPHTYHIESVAALIRK